MSIHSIKIKNYKLIKESTISFEGNMSGIYGPNGTGKTAVLEVIDILKTYFTYTYKNIFINELESEELEIKNLKKKILDGVTQGKESFSVEIVFLIKENLYKLYVEFKIKDDEVTVVKEEFSYKPNNSRKVFKNILRISNEEDELVPSMYVGNASIDGGTILDKAQIRKKVVVSFNNFYSYMSLILKYSLTEKISLGDEMKEFIESFTSVNNILKSIIIVTLKEQALYNLGIIIPLSYHINDFNYGTLPIQFGKSTNIYPEKIVNILEEVIKQINTIFSIIVPKSKLILEKKLANVEKNKKLFSFNIYVERDGIKLLLEKESTGIIKLVSLLSTMIHYTKDKNAIVVIDELDIHIFEYLLANLLEKLSYHAKGQLIFTAHNLLPMEKLNKTSIIISTKGKDENVVYTYLKGTSATTNLRNKYLKSQRMWSEENIEPFPLNTSALELYIKKLVI